MVMYPPQPAEPVSAGFNEETGDPVEITVSRMKIMMKALTMIMTIRILMRVMRVMMLMSLSVPDPMRRLEIL